MASSCIFCKIVAGEIPALKLYETPKTLAFMDIQPIAAGHALIIPKFHGAKLHDIPDDYLAEILPIAKKIAVAGGLDIDSPEGAGYNVLQNNGRIAHQIVDHVHLHLIPKRDEKTGLGVGWPQDKETADQVKQVYEELKKKVDQSDLKL